MQPPKKEKKKKKIADPLLLLFLALISGEGARRGVEGKEKRCAVNDTVGRYQWRRSTALFVLQFCARSVSEDVGDARSA